jgi:hypothetical protein
MKKLLIATLLSTFFVAPVMADDDDYYGIIKSRPEGKVGEWVIGDKTINVTDAVEIEEDNGTAKVGACVEVDFDDNVVDEIEVMKNNKKCK